MTTVWIILGLLLAIIGLFASVVPVLPGPFISFVSLLVLSFARQWEVFSTTGLVVFAVLAVLVSLSDTLFSIVGARRYGASRYGITGSIIGMLVGMFYIPPAGIFLGAVVGALIGELVAGKTRSEALRAGWGVLVGNIVSMGVKAAYCGAVLFFYVEALF